MFLREGSQLQATVLALCCVTIVLSSVSAGPADAARFVRADGVELPREILPWRRDFEKQANELLASARRQIRAGDKEAGERRLRELLSRFPSTYAASDGERELAALRQEKSAATGRRSLGIAPPATLSRAPREPELPVAGWNTIVKPDPANLLEALVEAAGDRVFFEEGSARLGVRARAVLKNQARWLKSNPRVEVRIIGHADDDGSAELNTRLSHDRAVAVRRTLMRSGVSGRRLHVLSHGNSQPIAICSVKTCAAQNRRVVMEIRLSQHAGSGAQ